MKIKPGFQLRTLCNEHLVVAHGVDNIDFSKIIRLNESATYLWEKVIGTEFDAPRLAALLMEEYEVSEETALHDAASMMHDWAEAGIAE